MLNVTPIAEDVAMYSSTDVDGVVNAIVDDERFSGVHAVHRLETIDGRKRETDGVFTWVRTIDGSVLIDTDAGAEDAAADTVRDTVQRMVADIAELQVVGD